MTTGLNRGNLRRYTIITTADLSVILYIYIYKSILLYIYRNTFSLISISSLVDSEMKTKILELMLTYTIYLC